MATVAASPLLLFLVLQTSEALVVPFFWPLPQSLKHGSGVAALPTDHGAFFGDPATPLLKRAFERYSKIIFRGCDDPSTAQLATRLLENDTGVGSSHEVAVVPWFEFAISTPDAAGPAEHMDEFYELSVPLSGPAVARARTQWGVLTLTLTLSPSPKPYL